MLAPPALRPRMNPTAHYRRAIMPRHRLAFLPKSVPCSMLALACMAIVGVTPGCQSTGESSSTPPSQGSSSAQPNGGGASAAGTGAAQGSATGSVPIEGTPWRLVSINGAPVSKEEWTNAPGITLDAASGRFHSNSSVNILNGGFTRDGSKLTLMPGPMTMMAGPEPLMKQEQAFIAALMQVTRYQVQGQTLTMLNGDSPVLVFTLGEWQRSKERTSP